MGFQKFHKRKEACRKVRFRDLFDAMKRAKQTGLRAYACHLCNGWHLTSMEHKNKGRGTK